MTSPIGSRSTTLTPPLTSPNGRSSGQTNKGTSASTPAQQETGHPSAPLGPLGHNINTTA